jgi:hypothetical protein
MTVLPLGEHFSIGMPVGASAMPAVAQVKSAVGSGANDEEQRFARGDELLAIAGLGEHLARREDLVLAGLTTLARATKRSPTAGRRQLTE